MYVIHDLIHVFNQCQKYSPRQLNFIDKQSEKKLEEKKRRVSSFETFYLQVTYLSDIFLDVYYLISIKI